MKRTYRSILVFRRGLLGDNLVAAPALRCLREAYPQARLVLVSEVAPGEKMCWAQQVFGPGGLVDEVIPFAAYNARSRWRQISTTLSLYRILRTTPWELGVALDTVAKVHWEPTIFKILGAEAILAPRSNGANLRDSKEKCFTVRHIADQLIDILRPLGLPLPEPGKGSMDVNITSREVLGVDDWLQQIGASSTPKPWIAIGPWTNMPAKQWPTGRFTEVARRLQEAVGGTPFVLGGPQDADATRNLVQNWGFGIPVAGSLNVRQGIALLKRCELYIGNDSGTMHMAVSAGIRCVAIFSSRDKRGLWEPYGCGHIVLRNVASCEGCMQWDCHNQKNKCIDKIKVDKIFDACYSILNEHS
jgi:heptosyltransferase III